MQTDSEVRDIDQIVLAQHVDHLYENTPVAQIANVIGGAALVAMQWQVILHAILAVWLLAVVASSVVRYILVLLYRRDTSSPAKWIRRYRISMVASGVIWGGAGIFLFPPHSPTHQVYLMMILTMIVQGGVALYSAVRGIMYFFIVPAVPPLVYSLIMHGESETYVMVILLAMIVTVSAKLNHDVHQLYARSFRGAENLRREKEVALQAIREKDKYVSLIAHDLKSPFSSLIQLLSVFDDEDEPLDADKRAILKSIRTRCEESVATIDGVLHASRFTNEGIALKRRFLNAHMEALRATLQLKHQAEGKGIEVVNEIPQNLRVYADADLLGEVLQNLISNAIKFCRNGDRITLFAPPGETAAIAVRDTGTGIAPELLDGLFRHDVRTTRVGTHGEKGTGLGLPICRDILAAHGGDLTVESVPDQGSTFFIQLPEQRPLVLVVDDDDAARYALRKQLLGERFQVEEASDGEAALRKVAELKPDVVLLDILLPKVDGLTVLQRLKENPETQDVPVIVATSDSRMETRERALNGGAADFVAKPIRVEELVPRALKALA